MPEARLERTREAYEALNSYWIDSGLSVPLSPENIDRIRGLFEECAKGRAADESRIVAELVHACKLALNDRRYREWPEIADRLIAAIARAEGNGGGEAPSGDTTCGAYEIDRV